MNRQTALATPVPQRQRRTNALLWTVQIALAAVFLYMSMLRLTGAPSAVETFDRIGMGQWLRYVTGACELAGGIGLLIPPLAGLAAMGLVGVMIGATAADLLVLHPATAALTILLGVAAAVVAKLRWPQTRSLFRYFRR